MDVHVSDEKYEHTQALLGHDELNDNESSETQTTARRRPRHEWILLVLSILSSLLILLVVIIIFRRTIASASEGRPESKSGIFQDDYILSNDWDYTAEPTIRNYDWTLEEVEFNPDGVYRPMLLINNQFPGPLIEVNEGDTIKVTVHNRLNNATSIHWHGIYQNGTNYMDGTVGVTQCPIAPGTTFTYEFTIQGQSGTYWYHAHQAAQSSDGLAGPLIVHSKKEKDLQKLDYVSDRIIMLSDHYHHLTSALARQYLAPDMENTEPVPDGALVNGREIRNCDDFPTRRCDNSTIRRSEFLLEQQQSHRLRIINTGAFAEFQFQVDEHKLAITEADGTDLEPVQYHRLNISPAQRYSVVIHANQTHRDSFRMRATMVDNCFAGSNAYMKKEVEAVVKYSGVDHARSEPSIIKSSAQSILPDSLDWNDRLDIECRDMNTTELIPVEVIAAPDKEDAFFYLRTNFRIGAYRLSRGFFNESTWKHSIDDDINTPSLFQFIDNTPAHSNNNTNEEETDAVTINNSIFDPTTKLTIQSSGIQTIDLLIHNTDDGTHPMHLHGYKFFILAQGKGYPPRKSLLDEINRPSVQPLYDTLDLSNPLRRDTASIEAYSWMLIRFVADNPGMWAFHCHVAWHAEAGLMMQFLTRTDQVAEMVVPDANRELCRVSSDELRKGMTPVDESYVDEADGDDSGRSGTGCEGESAKQCSYGDRM